MAETITKFDTDVLLAVNHYDCLTVEQIMRIFNRKNRSHTNELIQKMRRLKLLEYKELQHTDPRGGVTKLNKVGPEGYKELKRLGIAYPRFEMGAKKIQRTTKEGEIVEV